MIDETRHVPPNTEQIDSICDKFETAWKQGNRPRIEDFLDEVTEFHRAKLIHELVMIDIAYRRLALEAPTVDEYLKRFKPYRTAVSSAFMELEEAKSGDATSGVARELLVGILAVQRQHIDLDELEEAVVTWMSGESKRLADVLEADQKLTPGSRRRIEALMSTLLDSSDAARPRSGAITLEVPEGPGEPVQRDAARPRSDAITPLGSICATFLDRASNPTVQAALLRLETRFESADFADVKSRYAPIKFHDEGGLGQVWIARDEELHRDVAYKNIKAKFANVADVRARFLAEAEITGRLEHPGVVPVYGLGCDRDGVPYYAMRFVRGDNLGDAIERYYGDPDSRARSLELRKLLRRFIDVCNTLEYAHSRRVLHRDLKPANIMLGNYGETLVVDWGLAKAIGEVPADGEAPADPASLSSDEGPIRSRGSMPTQAGAAIGTPQYMSPEQAAGQIHELGPATDIYSLGATLYCILTGQAPIQGCKLKEIFSRVQRGDIPKPRSLNPTISRPLEAVCMKALSTDPASRYESAKDLAEDVERWLADESVSAYDEGWADRAGRWARRNRSWVRAGAAALLVVAVVSTIAVVLVDHQRQRAEGLLDIARKNLYAVQLSNVEHLAATDPGRALAMLNDADRCPEDLRDFVWAYYRRFCRRDRLHWQPHQDDTLLADFFSVEEILTVGGDGTVKRWDASNGALLDSAETEHLPVAAAMSDDRRFLAMADEQGVHLRELPGLELVGTVAESETAATRVALTPDGGMLVSLHPQDGIADVIMVWDADQLPLAFFEAPVASMCMEVSPNGRLLAVGGRGADSSLGRLKVWDLEEQTVVCDLEFNLNEGFVIPVTLGISSIAFSRDSSALVVASVGGALGYVELDDDNNTAQVEIRVLAHHGTISSVSVGRGLIATAGPGDPRRKGVSLPFQPVVLWDAANFEKVSYLAGMTENVQQLHFSPGRRELLTVHDNGSVSVFDVSERWSTTKLTHNGQLKAVAYSPDGSILVTVVGDDAGRVSDVRHWDAKNAMPLETPDMDLDAVALVMPDGVVLDRNRPRAGEGVDAASVVDVLTGNLLAEVQLDQQDRIEAISPDRSQIVIGNVTSGIRMQGLGGNTARKQLASLRDGFAGPTVFSPRGALIACGSEDGRVRLWNRRAEIVATISGWQMPIRRLAFSPDEKTLAIGLSNEADEVDDGPASMDGPAAVLWDVDERRDRATLKGHTGDVYAFGFSADGRTLATGSFDATVRLWEVTSGIELALLPAHQGTVFSVAFSPDNETLATGSFDQTTKLWHAEAPITD